MSTAIELRQTTLVLLVGMAFVFSVCGAADAATYASCAFFGAHSSHTPHKVAELMRTRGDATSRACFDREGRLDLYRPVTDVREGGAHVCSYEILPVVYPVRGKLGSDRYMTEAGLNGCPLQGDPSYVWTDQLSEEVFVTLSMFAVHLCENTDLRPFVSSTVSSPAAVAIQLSSLCAGLPTPHHTLRWWLFSVSPDSATASGRNPIYWMRFGDFGVRGTAWSVWVSLEQGEAKVNKAQFDTGSEE